jgi:hypothetical protein
MMFRPLLLSLCVLIVPSMVLSVHAAESGKRTVIAGPVAAEVLRVIDGDTILVAAKPWPQQTMEVFMSGCVASMHRS